MNITILCLLLYITLKENNTIYQKNPRIVNDFSGNKRAFFTENQRDVLITHGWSER